MMKRSFVKLRKIVITAILVCVFFVGIGLAYLVDSEAASNIFTIGSINIEISEPGFNEDEALEVSPGGSIDKDPMISNVGKNEAYVFAAIAIPKGEVSLLDDDGQLIERKQAELFSFEANSEWRLIEKEELEEFNEYLFAYSQASGMTALGPREATEAIFNRVNLVDFIEKEDLSDADIVIRGFAIQTEDLEAKTPEEVWNNIISKSGGAL